MIRLALFLMLALAPVFPAGADLPGRLFFTPQQRAALDQARQHKTPAIPAKPPAISGRVTFDGFVKSSDGRSTVWINDKVVSGKDLPPGYAVAADAPGVLKLPVQKKRVQLKPGQSLDPDTGRVVEQYQNPPAPVVPAAPAPAPATARPGGDDSATDQTATP